MRKIEDIITAEFEDEHHKALINIRYTSNFIGSHYKDQLEEFDLSLAQFNILRILRDVQEVDQQKQVSIQSIKDKMVEKSPNTTRLIDKLISKSFIKRSRGEKDRRVVYIQITKEGLSILSQLDTHLEDDYFKKNLSEKEVVQLNFLLNKYRNE